MKKRAAFVIAAVLVAVALVLVWRHTRAQPANAVATKPAAAPTAPGATTPTPAVPSAPVATASSQPSPLAASAPVAAPTAAPLPTPPSAAQPIVAVPLPETPAPAGDPSSNAAAAAATVQTPAALPRIDEITGTRRMILAHAPLRDPKVADPDSAENRQVLQTMVQKALARAEKKP